MACQITMTIISVACILIIQSSMAYSLNKREADSEWHTMKKSDLCPNLQAAFYCPGVFSLDDLAKGIKGAGELSDKLKIPLGQGVVDHGNTSVECGKPLQKALCSNTKPLCLEDKGGSSPEARKVCEDIYNECPYLAGEDSLKQYVDNCEKYLLREYTDMTCEAVGSADFPKGGCTRPTQKVPAFYIPLYSMKSGQVKNIGELLENLNSIVNIFSSDCMTTMRQMMCLPITCSDTDENIVRIKNKQEDCKRTMECFNKGLDKAKDVPDIFSGTVNTLLDEVKGVVSKSCDSIVKTFEELVNPKPNEVKVDGTSVSSKMICPVFLLLFAVCFTLFVG